MASDQLMCSHSLSRTPVLQSLVDSHENRFGATKGDGARITGSKGTCGNQANTSKVSFTKLDYSVGLITVRRQHCWRPWDLM